MMLIPKYLIVKSRKIFFHFCPILDHFCFSAITNKHFVNHNKNNTKNSKDESHHCCCHIGASYTTAVHDLVEY